jgi:hypothetical protein
MVEKAFYRLAISKMRGDNFWGILGLDMSIEYAFRFNDYIRALLTETVTTSEIHLGMAYPLPTYLLLKRLIYGIRAAGEASRSLTNENSMMVFHTILHPPDS